MPQLEVEATPEHLEASLTVVARSPVAAAEGTAPE
jgi:hypothetical protein